MLFQCENSRFSYLFQKKCLLLKKPVIQSSPNFNAMQTGPLCMCVVNFIIVLVLGKNYLFHQRFLLSSERSEKDNLDRVVMFRYLNVLLHLCGKHNWIKFFNITLYYSVGKVSDLFFAKSCWILIKCAWTFIRMREFSPACL